MANGGFSLSIGELVGSLAVQPGIRHSSMKQLPPPQCRLPVFSHGSCFIGSSILQVISEQVLWSKS
jgi:hypothetical protein